MSTILRRARNDALNPNEVEQLLLGCRDLLDNLIVRLPVFTGMRIGEVQHMTRTWIVWEKGIIELSSRQLCSCYEGRTWRGGMWTPKTEAGIRNLLITGEIKSTLEDFFSSHEVVGRSRQALEQRIGRIRQRSGLSRRVYAHCLRATFATRLAEQGMSAPSLSYVMGWNGLEAAEHYVQSSMKRAHAEQQEIVNSVEERRRKL